MTDIARHLERQFQNGRVVLFAGAGFSLGCKDLDGRQLPTGGELARELWTLAYPGESLDERSSLQDIFEVVQRRSPKSISDYLSRRLTIDIDSIPAWYKTWIFLPWRRIYTLNVDDLFQALHNKYNSPRRLVTISAQSLRTEQVRTQLDNLEVIHLNGRIADGIEKITFSTTQYAERASNQEPLHRQVAIDIATLPVIFVGTPIEDQLLWQHLQLRGKKGPRTLQELRPQSYLISPTIPRAREELLRFLNIDLVSMSAEQFAQQILSQFTGSFSVGLQALSRELKPSGEVPSIVSSPSSKPSRRSNYLLGAEPEWADISFGVAIRRDIDDIIAKAISDSRRDKHDPGVVVITGTAGSGKTTSLMRAALAEVAEGRRVGWVGRDEDVSPAGLRHWAAKLGDLQSVYIDDIDRYGSEASRILDTVRHHSMIESIVVATRTSKFERVLDVPLLEGVISEVSMPPLSDTEIDDLLETLRSDGKLGQLRGLSLHEQRDVLRSKCGRLLLVAMLEATSSRRFEDKVVEEYNELNDTSKLIYALTSLSYSLRFPLPKTTLLVALGDTSNEILNAVDALTRRQLLTLENGRYRPRHRVIAETLIDHLQESDRQRLAAITARLTYAVAAQVVPPPDRTKRDWRFVISLINHERLLRTIDVHGARLVYEEVESLLDYDHHYWLQRGSLELEQGNVSLAENYILQSKSLEPEDYKVQTAYAYMLLKKAIQSPTNSRSLDNAEEAFGLLEYLIETRGASDFYVYHVLGSQGLAWVRRNGEAQSSKERLLRRLISQVNTGVSLHPRREELATLLTALRRTLLEFTTGLVPASDGTDTVGVPAGDTHT